MPTLVQGDDAPVGCQRGCKLSVRAAFHPVRMQRNEDRAIALGIEIRQRQSIVLEIAPAEGPHGKMRHFPYSFLMTSPPFITNFTCSKVVTSFTGSPSTATISAHPPDSRLPTLPAHPSRSAAFT